MEELIFMLNRIQRMSAGLEAHLRSIIRQQLFRKGDFLLRIGEISPDILFLRSGLVRSYYLYRDREVSNWFMREGDICVSILSFFDQSPAVDNIVALEDCECWGISFEQLEEGYRLFPEFNFHGRVIDNKYYLWSERRNLWVLRQTPEDKYAQIVENDPDLVSRITRKQLASFLNVSERTFYKIHKDYIALKKASNRRARRG
jgi:CRP/FNR family transcriptional regulator, anaerobic regulatory protein